MELFIGFDWADSDHDVYLTNEMAQDLDSFAIDDSLLGLDKFQQRIKKYGVENHISKLPTNFTVIIL